MREGKPLPYDVADILHVAGGLSWWFADEHSSPLRCESILLVVGGLDLWFADSRGHRPYRLEAFCALRFNWVGGNMREDME